MNKIKQNIENVLKTEVKDISTGLATTSLTQTQTQRQHRLQQGYKNLHELIHSQHTYTYTKSGVYTTTNNAQTRKENNETGRCHEISYSLSPAIRNQGGRVT